MYRLELKSLTAVDRHQTDGVEVERMVRDFAQSSFLGEKHELAHAIEHSLNRRAFPERRSLHKVQELPNRQRRHLPGDSPVSLDFAQRVRSIEQIGAQKAPRTLPLREAFEIVRQSFQA